MAGKAMSESLRTIRQLDITTRELRPELPLPEPAACWFAVQTAQFKQYVSVMTRAWVCLQFCSAPCLVPHAAV